jgi:hypothetical protein
VSIERATEADTDIVSQLLGEVGAFYGGPDTQANSRQTRVALFSPRPAARALSARDGDRPWVRLKPCGPPPTRNPASS